MKCSRRRLLYGIASAPAVSFLGGIQFSASGNTGAGVSQTWGLSFWAPGLAAEDMAVAPPKRPRTIPQGWHGEFQAL